MPDLPKNKRFFVDIITAAMHRMPDVEETEEGKKRYANHKDREMTEAKMRAVLRIAKAKGAKRLVLGAWGCGAYQNPLSEIAAAWRKLLLDDPQCGSTSKAIDCASTVEHWNSIEIVFAIKERKMAEQFAECFGQQVEVNEPSNEVDADDDNTADEAAAAELKDKIAQLESQIAATRSDVLRQRLTNILDNLRSSQNEGAPPNLKKTAA